MSISIYSNRGVCNSNRGKISTIILKVLNPYGTKNIVPFDIHYETSWKTFEIFIFAFLGVLGGLTGALFVKAWRLWGTTVRRIPIIQQRPLVETTLVGLITSILSFWNRYTRSGMSKLLTELATPCGGFAAALLEEDACPILESVPGTIKSLAVAFVIKSFLTLITFGLKVPAGIYVPSMVVGGLLGKIVGLASQLVIVGLPDAWLFSECSASDRVGCVTPGVYAMICAGATMCGVTRLPMTLTMILIEVTASWDYFIPFCVAIFLSRMVADAIESMSVYVSFEVRQQVLVNVCVTRTSLATSTHTPF